MRAQQTVRILLTAEERLRQRAHSRIRAVVRMTVATLFFTISALISIGANVTTAFAKKVTTEREKHHPGLRLKRMHFHHATRHHAVHVRRQVAKASNEMRGMASWYGKEFHNRKTASGVRFDTHAMMAAHRTLPFGTKVRVTNLANHKSCIVQITDRGPYAAGRIIDLSLAAAEELEMTNAGVAEVKLEVLGAHSPSMLDDLAIPTMMRGNVPALADDDIAP